MGHGSRFGSSFPRPLVFAGGVERRAGDKAAIGVWPLSVRPTGRRDEMDMAQRISARCQRYQGDSKPGCMRWKRCTINCSSSSRMN
jgi:hypothetical protein